MMLHIKYQGSRPFCFRQEDFFIFSPIDAYIKYVTPVQGHFGPSGITLTNSVEVHQVMLHIKYQGSMPCSFGEDFFRFSSYNSMYKM